MQKTFFFLLICAVYLTGCSAQEPVANSLLSSKNKAVTEAIDDATENAVVVVLMGDPQLYMNPNSLENTKTAMDDIVDIEHDFLAVLGDLVQNKAEYYTDYDKLILQASLRPHYSLAGNSDLNAGHDAYQAATGLPLYYTIHKRGIRFVFLSVISVSGQHAHICNLGSEQLDWLTKQLASDTESTTCIFFHAPVFETTWHTENRSSQPMPGSMYLGESGEMRSLFSRYPNIKVYASGHLHHSYGLKDEFGRSDYFMEDNVLHINVGATANNKGSSVLYIEKNRIVVKVRNHKTQSWKNEFEYVYPVKTTLTTSDPADQTIKNSRKN